jgi:hypothetical protein
MVTAQERMRILQMLQEGKLTPEAAAQLLDALGDSGEATATGPVYDSAPFPVDEPRQAWVEGKKANWLRVRVTDTNSGRPRVNVRMPLSLVNLGLKMGAHFAPEIDGLDLAELLRAAQEGDASPFVDVIDHEDGERVEVFVE